MKVCPNTAHLNCIFAPSNINSKEKETIEVVVCDEKLSVTVNKDERQLYENSTSFVTQRYSWYMKTYGKIKFEKDISRMVLVDICIEKNI